MFSTCLCAADNVHCYKHIQTLVLADTSSNADLLPPTHCVSTHAGVNLPSTNRGTHCIRPDADTPDLAS